MNTKKIKLVNLLIVAFLFSLVMAMSAFLNVNAIKYAKADGEKVATEGQIDPIDLFSTDNTIGKVANGVKVSGTNISGKIKGVFSTDTILNVAFGETVDGSVIYFKVKDAKGAVIGSDGGNDYSEISVKFEAWGAEYHSGKYPLCGVYNGHTWISYTYWGSVVNDSSDSGSNPRYGGDPSPITFGFSGDKFYVRTVCKNGNDPAAAYDNVSFPNGFVIEFTSDSTDLIFNSIKTGDEIYDLTAENLELDKEGTFYYKYNEDLLIHKPEYLFNTENATKTVGEKGLTVSGENISGKVRSVFKANTELNVAFGSAVPNSVIWFKVKDAKGAPIGKDNGEDVYEIKVKFEAWGNYYNNGGYPLCGVLFGKTWQSFTYYGTVVNNSSDSGSRPQYGGDPSPLKFEYNSSTKSFIFRIIQMDGQNDPGIGVSDVSFPNGYVIEFTSDSTDLTFNSVTVNSASYMLNTKNSLYPFIDTTPSISDCEYEETYKANQEITLLTAVAKDYKDNQITPTISVVDKDGNPVEIKENKFTPTLHGEYTITYTAVDAEGNTVSKEYKINSVVEYEVRYISISTAGDIGLNFYVYLSDTTETIATITMNGNSVQVAGVYQKSLDCWKYTYGVAPKDYKTLVTLEVLDITVEYSVENYAKALPEDNAAYPIVTALIEYCEAARVYFAGEEATVTEDLTADLSEYAATVTGEEENVTIAGATLVLESKTTINVYVRAESLEDVVCTVDGKAVTPIALEGQDGQYVISISGIVSKDLDKVYTIKVGGYTITYCALSYVKETLSGSSANVALANLVKALYSMSMAAESYFAVV